MIHFGLEILSGPAEEPVTRNEAKDWLRQTGNDRDDAMIESLIRAIRRKLEEEYDITLCTQTRRLTLDSFPWGECQQIELPRPPLRSVLSVTYRDAAGDTQTVDADTYLVDAASRPGRVLPVLSSYWPIPGQSFASAKVTYTCGYGSPSDVPEDAKTGIKLALASLYAGNRGEDLKAGNVAICPAAKWIFGGLWSGAYR